MKYKKIIAIVIFSFCSLIAFSQGFEELYNAVQVKYGLDQILINGAFFEHDHKNNIGHPYFFSDEFQKGHLIIHDKRFDNLLLKFNVFDQNIIIRKKDRQEAPMYFLPPMEYIIEFVIGKHKFRKYKFSDKKDRFYEEVYSGKLSCLYEWRKRRTSSDHNRDYFAFEYYPAKKKSYLVSDNTLKQYKSKGSFIKLFPPEHKKAISRYIKENQINVRTSPNDKISELVSYCERLLFN